MTRPDDEIAALLARLNEITEEDGMCPAERCFDRNPLRLCPDGSVCSCCEGCACVDPEGDE